MTTPLWHHELDLVTAVPPNAGTPLHRQTGEMLEPEQVYVRSNFPVPVIDPEGWELSIAIGGSRRTMSLQDVLSLPQTTVTMTLECAGNGRTLMNPTPVGTPWTWGGASTTSFTGPVLSDVLDGLDMPSEAVELVFTGADRGTVPEDGEVPYQYSLSVEEALHGTAMLAHSMSGEPLAPEHGAPVRLVVPGQYAMKSVKWLTSIEAASEAFTGHFVRKYRYFSDSSEPEEAPVGSIQVRSLIASPADGDEVAAGPVVVSGVAWSDGSGIASVEVSADDGASWVPAALAARGEGAFAPTAFSASVDVLPGSVTVLARATDGRGGTQPLAPRWNGNGYGNNVTQRVTIAVA